jgi:hypothetical protein
MGDMPYEAVEEFKAHEKIVLDSFIRFITKWPSYRKHAAIALLGGAVAQCDMMGADADGFLKALREREPRPAPLVPPRTS